MRRKGCFRCGRHPEEEARGCPDCGLGLPTDGQQRLAEARRQQAQAGGLIGGIAMGALFSERFVGLGLNVLLFPLGALILAYILIRSSMHVSSFGEVLRYRMNYANWKTAWLVNGTMILLFGWYLVLHFWGPLAAYPL